jgi:hypothetical protein
VKGFDVETDVPDLQGFRSVVEKICHRRDATLIKAAYLCAARVSELVTKVTPYDLQHGQTRPYGSHLSWKLTELDASLEEKKVENKVLLLKSAVAKRSSKNPTWKIIALPCHPQYEPWTLDLLQRIKDTGNLSFPLTRYRVHQILQKRLGALLNNNSRRILNPLRHYRLTHLVQDYGFDAYDLTVYAGWTFKTTFKGSAGQLDTYLHLDWRKYYQKLLKPIKSLA